MDKDIPKGVLDEGKLETDSEREGGDEEDGDDVLPPINELRAQETAMDLQLPKHVTKISDRAEKVLMREWFCCKCLHGPLNRDIYKACYIEGCQHTRCGRCQTENKYAVVR